MQGAPEGLDLVGCGEVGEVVVGSVGGGPEVGLLPTREGGEEGGEHLLVLESAGQRGVGGCAMVAPGCERSSWAPSGMRDRARGVEVLDGDDVPRSRREDLIGARHHEPGARRERPFISLAAIMANLSASSSSDESSPEFDASLDSWSSTVGCGGRVTSTGSLKDTAFGTGFIIFP